MIRPNFLRWAASVLSILAHPLPSPGHDWFVSSSNELQTALASAATGDQILLAPGSYQGGLFRAGLTGVTIRSEQADNRAVIQGGTNGLQLSDASDVTIESIVFAGAEANGINVDDGGSFSTPSSGVTIRDVEVRDVGSDGNHDGIKLSGVTGFLVDRVSVVDWGSRGSAIDMVGSHRGVIQNSYFHSDTLSDFGSVVRPKGGSKHIVIRANRLEIPTGQGRAIQAGGSTGAQFFRYLDGESGYEASAIEAYGNVVLAAAAAFSYVNIDGGQFHHNYVERPRRWAVRILNENQGDEFVDTKNGVFTDNRIVFRNTPDEWSSAVNVGPETEPGTFVFARNQWFDGANPTPDASTPSLPVTESDGIYGVDPMIDPADPIRWEFPWGEWIVLAAPVADSVTLEDPNAFLRATPGESAEFIPTATNPFVGAWEFAPIDAPVVSLDPFSSVSLVRRIFHHPVDLPADFNMDGRVDANDLAIWDTAFGQPGDGQQIAGDADGDLDADGHDFLAWQRQFLLPAWGGVRGTGAERIVGWHHGLSGTWSTGAGASTVKTALLFSQIA